MLQLRLLRHSLAPLRRLPAAGAAQAGWALLAAYAQDRLAVCQAAAVEAAQSQSQLVLGRLLPAWAPWTAPAGCAYAQGGTTEALAGDQH